MINSTLFSYKLIFCSVIVLMLLSFAVSAQQKRGKGDLLYKADYSYNHFRYMDAIEQYTLVLKKDAGDKSAIYGLANCYLQLNDFSRALENFNKLRSSWIDSAKFMYSYVQTLKANGKYEQAGKNCEDYLLRHPDDVVMKVLAAQLKQVEGLYSDSSNWHIGFLNINSNYRDYSPVLLENSLVYVSTRPSGRGRIPHYKYKYTNQQNSLDLARIYEVKDTENIIMQPVGDQALKVNTDEEMHYMPISLVDEKEMNVGPVTFSKDGKKVYYTVNNKLRDRTSWLGIMGANYSNGKITGSKLFAYNEKQYSVEHPALSPDGRFLYFSSNKPGGIGNFDLYSCEADGSGKNWLSPKNLGSLVNTGGNEMFPYVDSAGNLYFSSDGIAGLGGLDIFYIKMKDGIPIDTPKNLGYPVNSSFDDFGITTIADGTYGYFSSNRREENDDIYRFNHLQTKNYKYIRGTVFDADTKLRVSGVSLDIKDSEGKTTNLVSDSAGNFKIALNNETVLNTNAQKEGYTPLIQQLNTEQLVPYHFMTLFLEPGGGSDKQEAAVPPGTGNTRSFKEDLEHFTDSLHQTIEEKYIVHYEFDSSVVIDEDIPILDTIASALKEHPELYVVVASFTDCHGNIVYNAKLSKRRSAFVRRYLQNKGVPDKNINTEYFGKKYLVLPCKEDKNFNKQVQQSNRRSEIIITKDKNERWHPLNTLGNNNETIDNDVAERERKQHEKLSKRNSASVSSDLQEDKNEVADNSVAKNKKKRKQHEKLLNRRSASVSKGLQKKDKPDKVDGQWSFNTQGNAAVKGNGTINETTNDKVVKERSGQEETLFDKINERINNDSIFLETTSDSVSIALYDNGVFDHDSVSVVYNNKILTTKLLLNVDKAATFHLRIDVEQKNNKLVFYADNLGDISPNSCLMVVYDGIKRTEIPVTTDLKHNTIVIFMKRKAGKT